MFRSSALFLMGSAAVWWTTGEEGKAQSGREIERTRAASICAATLQDSIRGGCLEASADATLGMLFPLSVDFYLNPFTRFVGMGTTNPVSPLEVIDTRTEAGRAAVSIESDSQGGRALFAKSNDVAVGSVPSGIWGRTDADIGIAIYGSHKAGSAISACGVAGSTNGGGSGVSGLGEDPMDDNNGVYGLTRSEGFGRGVLGWHESTLGTGAGVEGRTSSVAGSANGVLGEVTSATPGGFSAGVRGINRGTGGLGIGVYGSHAGTGWGVYGLASSNGVGVLGSAPTPGLAVLAQGDSGATGTKSFVQPHPTDPSKEIRFVSLEGNEAGTYFRGTARLEKGRATIFVPAEFRHVTESDSLTVQLTAIGRGDLWIESKSLEQIQVAGDRDLEFDYFVNGVRRGFDHFQSVQQNRVFVPRVHNEAYLTGPQIARELLVQNGTLNPDYTPNEATARQMGWNLADPEHVPESRDLDNDELQVVPMVE